MSKIATTFKVQVTRPLHALGSTSIAELAQFTRFSTDGRFPVADAESAVRREWGYEIDAMHDLNHLDMKKATLWFRDGSTLTFTR